MKSRIIIIAIALLSFQMMYAQPEIVLTFTGTYNSYHVQLDSVKITNLTQGGDTSIYKPDTVLVLQHSIGIDEDVMARNKLALMQAHPNPFSNSTEFECFLPDEQQTTVIVTDVSGRLLFKQEKELNRGWHAFELRANNTGYYFVTIATASDSKMIKLLSQTGGSGSAVEMAYKGWKPATGNIKSVSQTASFPYNLGDQLYFIGYTGSDGDTLADNPVADADYEFEFQSGGFACPSAPLVSYEGKDYNTIQIGDQCWFRENLDVGDFITSDVTMTNNDVFEKYCYENNEDNCAVYGGLYQWNEIMNYVTAEAGQGICPEGWHIPSNDEWLWLQEFLGGDRNAGGLLKEAGTAHWNEPNVDATNESGFTGLPGGFAESGVFVNMGAQGHFWTSSTFGLILSTGFELRNDSKNLFTNNHVRTRGFSVRCLQDVPVE